MSRKPYTEIITDAWAAFDEWRNAYDPDSLLGPEELAVAYGAWCDVGNRVKLEGGKNGT